MLGVGGDAGVLGEQLMATVAQRAAQHAGAGDERGLERGVVVTQVQHLERAIGHARRAQYCDYWRITLPPEHEDAGERPAERPPEDLHAHARAATAPPELTREQIERLESIYGNRYLLEPAPDHKLPRHGMSAREAKGLVEQETLLDGLPARNLATFVTTWMEPEADELIRDSLRVNFIDHAEYPQTAEIEQRCIRMLADLFNAPGETTGARTQGSSEAIMLGALSLKWKWRARREAAGKATDRPNLVFGGDVHVVWEKFCRYFDVEPRIVPLKPDKYTIGAEDVEPHIDENTIGVAAVLGTTFTGHADDIRRHQRLPGGAQAGAGAGRAAARGRGERRLRVAVPVPEVGVGLPPRAGALDQRLGPQVRPRVPGDRLAGVPREVGPARGPRVLRELPGQARRDVHAELLDGLGDGARAVLQLRAPRPLGLPLRDGDDEVQRAHAREGDRGDRRVRADRLRARTSSCRWWRSN